MEFWVKVIPKASRTELVGQMEDGTWKVRVAAVPEKGKANAELCEFLAGVLGVPKSAVAVVSGEGSRLKRVRAVGAVAGLDRMGGL